MSYVLVIDFVMTTMNMAIIIDNRHNESLVPMMILSLPEFAVSWFDEVTSCSSVSPVGYSYRNMLFFICSVCTFKLIQLSTLSYLLTNCYVVSHEEEERAVYFFFFLYYYKTFVFLEKHFSATD